MDPRPALRRILALTGGILAVAATAGGALPRQSVSVMLQWTPQAQFAGFYAALDRGFYARRGLDVRLLHAGPDRDSAQALSTGEADFVTLFLPTALVQRDRGVPLVNVGQFVQRSSLVLIGREDHGIRHPRNLDAQRVSLWGDAFEPPYLAFFTLLGISVDAVPQHGSVNLFLRGGVEACCAMYYNEYHAIWQAGLDEDQIEPFFLRDWGLDFPEDGLYALASTATRSPDLAQALLLGTMEGWRFSQASPDAALDLVMQHVQDAGVPTNRPHMAWMLTHILPTILPDEENRWHPGTLSRESYLRTVRTLETYGVLRHHVSFDLFCPPEISRVP